MLSYWVRILLYLTYFSPSFLFLIGTNFKPSIWKLFDKNFFPLNQIWMIAAMLYDNFFLQFIHKFKKKYFNWNKRLFLQVENVEVWIKHDMNYKCIIICVKFFHQFISFFEWMPGEQYIVMANRFYDFEFLVFC